MDTGNGDMANWFSGGENSVNEKLSKAIGAFGAQLGSSRMGTLTQAWVPEPGDDGGVVMNTQGLPFCVNGTADLLALFRCISCKYKFSTDTTKPWMMGPVGRVYTSGEPELTRSVQQYDQSVYLRVAEAQRCHVNCCLFLPVYATSSRDRVAAVMEVVQTEDNERFAGLIDWAKVCLEGAGLWTIEAEGDTVGMGLRTINAEFEASAFESKIDARAGGVVRTITGAASMPPPPPTSDIGRSGGLAAVSAGGPNNQSLGWQHPGLPASNAAEADDAIGGSGHAEQTLHMTSRGGVVGGGVVQQQQLTAQIHTDRIVRVGNQLVLSSDAPIQPHWHNVPLNAAENLSNGGNGLGSGSGGSSEPISQQRHPIPGVATNALAAANAAAANGYGGLPLNALLHQQPAAAAAAGGIVTIPQGYATSYGHGDNAITVDDLSPHFHLSLRDAAARMGISVTTLKRACRRLGLQKWPRRELASKANEASQQQAAAAAAATAAAAAAVAATAGGGGGENHNLFSWASGQTISADSSGDHHRVAAAAAMAANAPQSHQGQGALPPYTTTTTAAAAAAQHMIRPPMSSTGPAIMMFVPGMNPLSSDALPHGGAAGVGVGIVAGRHGGGGGVSHGGYSNGGAMGDLQTQTHSLESLDILAAADVETFSVGNSPPGGRNRGGGGGGGGDGDDDVDGGLFSTAHMTGPVSAAMQ